MASLTGYDRSQYVKSMFARIAHRYDLMNRIMTLGQDVRWRNEVIRRAALSPTSQLLDIGAGTGDLAREALNQSPTSIAVAADFTLEMMQAGQNQGSPADLNDRKILWSGADAHQLPFADQTFDAVVSGFLLRNVSDIQRSLSEQFRVLKPLGKIVALDTTPPTKTPLAPLIQLHLHFVIPAMGRMIARHKDAYKYLPDSTEKFLEPEQLADQLQDAGFVEVGFRRLMLGTIAIHWGIKPEPRKDGSA